MPQDLCDRTAVGRNHRNPGCHGFQNRIRNPVTIAIHCRTRAEQKQISLSEVRGHIGRTSRAGKLDTVETESHCKPLQTMQLRPATDNPKTKSHPAPNEGQCFKHSVDAFLRHKTSDTEEKGRFRGTVRLTALKRRAVDGVGAMEDFLGKLRWQPADQRCLRVQRANSDETGCRTQKIQSRRWHKNVPRVGRDAERQRELCCEQMADYGGQTEKVRVHPVRLPLRYQRGNYGRGPGRASRSPQRPDAPAKKGRTGPDVTYGVPERGGFFQTRDFIKTFLCTQNPGLQRGRNPCVALFLRATGNDCHGNPMPFEGGDFVANERLGKARIFVYDNDNSSTHDD